MIDIENEIFAAAAQEVRSAFPGVFISGEAVRKPAAFPFVAIAETGSFSPVSLLDSGGEKYAGLVYRVEVWSNLPAGRKAQCREIFSVLDRWLCQRNFTRTECSTAEEEKGILLRLSARYEVITDGTRLFRISK